MVHGQEARPGWARLGGRAHTNGYVRCTRHCRRPIADASYRFMLVQPWHSSTRVQASFAPVLSGSR